MADLNAVERLLADSVGSVFPSAQLTIVDGASRTERHFAVGDCTVDTLFDVASLTKALVTTTLAMIAIEEQRLALDDELRPGVTVQHALSHATGLPAWQPLWQRATGRDAIVELVRREPLVEKPGTRSVYSDLGFILLGDAIERAFGQRLDEIWRARVPLYLRYAPPDPAACAPTRPEPELRGVVHDDNARAMGGIAPHAGVFATAREVAAVAMLLRGAWEDGRTLVDHATVRRFWSPSGVPDSTWCLGWDRPSLHGSSAGERWPKDGVGHLGFTGCSLWIDPPRRRCVVLLSNRVYPTVENQAIKALRPRLHDAIVAALDDGAG